MLSNNSRPKVTTGKSTVKQSFKDECDINNIMKKYINYGTLPQMINENAQYGDFVDVPTYHESCNIVLKAEEQFNALPANVRKRFGNDPAEMLAFCSNPENLEEMYKLGLAIKPPENQDNSENPVIKTKTTQENKNKTDNTDKESNPNKE